MKSILLIEDQTMLHGIYRDALQTCDRCFSWPVRILLASSMAEADLIASTAHPDVALLDLTLGDSHGNDTIEAIPSKRKQWGCPIVVLTGDLDNQCRIDCFNNQVDDFCTKDILPRHAWVLMQMCYNSYLRYQNERSRN